MEFSLSAIEIRDASYEDMEAIEAIYAYHVLNTIVTMEEIPPSLEELNNRRIDSQEKGLPYVVATWNGEVLGYCYVAPYRPRSGYRFTVEDSVYLHPDYKGKGVGSLLLSAIIVRCKQAGIRQIIATISRTENPASIQLHKKHSFVLNGTLRTVGFKFGTWMDVVLMQYSV